MNSMVSSGITRCQYVCDKNDTIHAQDWKGNFIRNSWKMGLVAGNFYILASLIVDFHL